MTCTLTVTVLNEKTDQYFLSCDMNEMCQGMNFILPPVIFLLLFSWACLQFLWPQLTALCCL
jgi:hypothetical protein